MVGLAGLASGGFGSLKFCAHRIHYVQVSTPITGI
jgi:hypothetical protein